MNERTSRSVVSALAASVWVLTAAIVMLTFVELAQWEFFTAAGWALLRSTPLFTAFINMLFVAAFGAAVGYGLLKRKRWARVLALVFSALVILDLVIYLFSHSLSVSVLLSLLLAAAVLWLLGFNTDVRKQFR